MHSVLPIGEGFEEGMERGLSSGRQNMVPKISWDLGLNSKEIQAECSPIISLKIKKIQPQIREKISQGKEENRVLSLFR